jgi:2-C-methyl-D-erythritol 4-phosphate cytidylyltransferase
VGLFSHREEVATVTIITSSDRFDVYREHLHGVISAKKLHFTEGGRERWESVLFGLRFLAGRRTVPSFVAIHDAARPMTPAAVIDAAFEATKEYGAALPAVAEPATLKRRGHDGLISETVSRQNLFQAQTPQCFGLGKLLAAYEHLLFAHRVEDLTDDAQVYERMGYPVPITAGSALNLKITTADDLGLAKALTARA